MASQREPDDEALQDDELQYGHGPMSMEELDAKYGSARGRPKNHSKTPLFSRLIIGLFDPLNDQKQGKAGPAPARKKVGPHGRKHLSPHEKRRQIIEQFISRWRNDVGNDFYPALRLILPEKDKDRPMYGLKEKGIGKLIVKMLKISTDSETAKSLLNWKLPGKTTASRLAGDFAGRCYEAMKSRAMRSNYGDMRIAEVNSLLDRLAAVSKEEDQLPIFEQFFERMNAEELQWLIRIMLREMKVGASEKTILTMWHRDGEALFNVCSNLRRVCWDLADPDIQLGEKARGITLMECFQPQLAQFQMRSVEQMIDRITPTEEELTKPTQEDKEFWIEEKLDGERMQLHMEADDNVPGGRKFTFWSRKGKDYTYLYGNGLEDDKSALTRFLKDAFNERVEDIILDGEMITWDPVVGRIVAFGTLKTAALSEQRNPFGETGNRPVFRIFDCLYVNGTDITMYTLKDRRQALEQLVNNVDMRMEKHKYLIATTAEEVDVEMKKIIAAGSEGLVLKNPRSLYQLNSRNDDWQKVKPEYMTGFGENLDCMIIGGYYGGGHRGGTHGSFLCGLRVDDNAIKAGADPMKCLSFFKVGGGLRVEDFAKIRHQTEGKWHKWDTANPPTDIITLGGTDRQQYERPDEWIRPCDSVVIEVKAASVEASDRYGFQYSLRFPRYKRLRDDKTWREALSTYEFIELKNRAEEENKNKDLTIDTSRRVSKRLKKDLIIAGSDSKIKTPYAGPHTKAFEGLTFCVLTDMLKPTKKSKAEIEQIVKNNGGSLIASPTAKDGIVVVAEKRIVRVASLLKRGDINIIKPSWILDALKQIEIDGQARDRFLVPFEPKHMLYFVEALREDIEGTLDVYGDSYARDTDVEELRVLVRDMVKMEHSGFDSGSFLDELEGRGRGLEEGAGNLFRRCVVHFVVPVQEGKGENVDLVIARSRVLFGGGTVSDDEADGRITQVVVVDRENMDMSDLRRRIAHGRTKLPRIVAMGWLNDCWKEKTLLDEERYAVAT